MPTGEQILDTYRKTTQTLQQVLDSFTASSAQKDAAEETIRDLGLMLAAHSITQIEGRTALLTGLIAEVDAVIASIQEGVDPLGNVLENLNGVLETSRSLLSDEKEALRESAGVSLAVAGLAAVGGAAAGTSESYIVRAGDTIAALTAVFGVTESKLREMNPQLTEASEIAPGNVLLVPPNSTADGSVHLSIVPETDTPWYEIAKREMETGVAEEPGEGDNPRIVEFHKSTNLAADLADDDETPWCSSFVNWCMEQAGTQGTNSARAKSWLNWGRAVDPPSEGCVVVLNRTEDPAKGHVGFFLRVEGDDILVLGGNQSDAINTKPYPISRLAGYRLP